MTNYPGLKRLEQYSEEELENFEGLSEAFKRYLPLLKRATTSLEERTFEQKIRLARLKAWCESALATYYTPDQTEKVCLYWSQAADQLLTETFYHLDMASEHLSLFAMGKLGASELNLSSDVDLIFVSENSPSEAALKKVRRFVKALSTITDLGYGLRVDLDLRPGGRFAPLICSLAQFQDHYWNQAELWERLALVRLRPIVGSDQLTHEILKIREKFCFRRYIDLTLLDELKKLRPKIHATAATVSFSKKNINLKLSPGFIRDIELFINANQILLAGKFPELKTSSTTAACKALAKVAPQKDQFNTYLKTYWSYRQLENQVQAIQDMQTHQLNLETPPKGWGWSAGSELLKEAKAVDESIAELLGRRQNTTDKLKASLEQIAEEDLRSFGFATESIETTWPKIKSASAPFKNRVVDEDLRSETIQLFLTELSNSKFDKDLGLMGLADFLSSAKAKSTLFKLLVQEPRLIQDLSYLFSLSPYLGTLFSNRPELIDTFFLNLDEEFSSELESSLLQMAERKAISEIRTAVSYLKTFDLALLTESLTNTADQITNHLLKILSHDLKVSGLGVIALGKWGGQELGFRSDLDFIFTCEEKITEAHHKVARRFISRLRDTSAGGSIYQVDLRLRPDGKGGSIITSRNQIHEFLHTAASGWERQAYLKARQILTDINCLNLHDWSRPLSEEDVLELRSIRRKLLKPKSDGIYLIKYNHGGLIDIELGIQGALLLQKIKPPSPKTLDFFDALGVKAKDLKDKYLLLRKIEQLGRILSNHSGDEFRTGTTKFRLCAQVLEMTEDSLSATLENCLNECSKILKTLDPIY